jgi:hypothetical protein
VTFFEELVAVVGNDCALQLLAKFGGKVVYFPQLRGYEGAKKPTAQIVGLYDQGLTPVGISERMGVRTSTVIDVLEECLTTNVSNTRETAKRQQRSP